MTKLWKKTGTKLHPAVEKYTAATDPVFDMEFLLFDVEASRTHAKGLKTIGILTKKELTDLESGLDSLVGDFKAGKVRITPEDEDCYTVIENYLVKRVGEAGKKINTGRSRNEVVTMVRLYMRSHLGTLRAGAIRLADQFVDYADKYKNVPMVGYSHTQQAMLSSVGHYMAAHAESLLDDADYLRQTAAHINKSPVGSAAGFGTSIPVDRAFTAKHLKFEAIQLNSLYCHNSRGKFESAYMEALAQVMLTLGKFANDMLLFTSQEFDYFAVDASLTTGSSIMPHKHNLDALEIIRGNVSVVVANQLMVKDIAKNLLSGYNRDGQLMKKPLVESTGIVHDSLEIASVVLAGLTPKADNMKARINPGIFTADIANAMVMKDGVPFRVAYKKAAGMNVGDVDLTKNIASKKSLGAPGNLDLAAYRRRIRKAV